MQPDPTRRDPVMLDALAASVPDLSPRVVGRSVAVADLHHDSRTVEPGHGFVAIRGAQVDGHVFALAAVGRGAVAIVVERPLAAEIPQLLVSDTREALPRLAATVHGRPSEELSIVGVTGTNGKTTVTHMLDAIASAAGRRTGVIGTVGALIADSPVTLARTTPEATDLQRLLRRMVGAGVDVVALEVSSHALVLGRADAVRFDVVAFTNLSQDHLDFHHDMRSYAAAKALLFDADRADRAVIWRDDPVGAEVIEATSLPVTSVGFEPGADVRGEIIEMTAERSVVLAETPQGHATFEVRIAGRFNVANALVAAGCALALGLDLDSISTGLTALGSLPGRFEVVDAGHPFTIVVDYAHTPQAISEVIAAARDLTDGRVIALVGAGGDRDRAKRQAMGAAVATADLAVITSDNPRSEDPEVIMGEVVRGAGAGNVHIEVDRRAAIEWAVGVASRGDIVLVLGKGHETGQERAGVVEPFNDREVVIEAVQAAQGGVS